MFKGTLAPNVIEFKYYSYVPPPLSTGSLHSATANFRPGTRYIVFLKRDDLDLEVANPAYQMEIEIAPQSAAPISSTWTPGMALANELTTSIQWAPTTLGRGATRYFDWTEELIGTQSIPRVQAFLMSGDRLVRYQAAWWLSFRTVDATVLNQLRETAQDANTEEWARSGAASRLRDMAGREIRPMKTRCFNSANS